jgi:hypothetical protein
MGFQETFRQLDCRRQGSGSDGGPSVEPPCGFGSTSAISQMPGFFVTGHSKYTTFGHLKVRHPLI